MILDPMFPAQEPCLIENVNIIFGIRFGIPLRMDKNRWFIHKVRSEKLLRMYSIPEDINPFITSFPSAMLDDILTFSLTWRFRFGELEDNHSNFKILNYFTLGNSNQCGTAQCYFTTAPPDILDWKSAYGDDMDTKLILQELETKKDTNWTVENLKQTSAGYKTSLKDGIIRIFNKKLVLYKHILANNRFVALIIVPTALRRKIFIHFHAGPNGGHKGEYKTLYRM